jgi:sec-independent protein translocase protein TatA
VIGDILQPTHLLFVLVIALLVLGPKRLPEVGRSLGRGLRDFRSAISGEDQHDQVPPATGDEAAAQPAHPEVDVPSAAPTTPPASTEVVAPAATPPAPTAPATPPPPAEAGEQPHAPAAGSAEEPAEPAGQNVS